MNKLMNGECGKEGYWLRITKTLKEMSIIVKLTEGRDEDTNVAYWSQIVSV